MTSPNACAVDDVADSSSLDQPEDARKGMKRKRDARDEEVVEDKKAIRLFRDVYGYKEEMAGVMRNA